MGLCDYVMLISVSNDAMIQWKYVDKNILPIKSNIYSIGKKQSLSALFDYNTRQFIYKTDKEAGCTLDYNAGSLNIIVESNTITSSSSVFRIDDNTRVVVKAKGLNIMVVSTTSSKVCDLLTLDSNLQISRDDRKL